MNKTTKIATGFAKMTVFVFIFSVIFAWIERFFNRLFGRNKIEKTDEQYLEVRNYYKIYGTYCISCKEYVPKESHCANCGKPIKQVASTKKLLPGTTRRNY